MFRRFRLAITYTCFALAVSIATAALVLAPNQARAIVPEIDDLLGRWCNEDGHSYTFTRTSLEVTWRDGEKKTLPIVKIEPIQDFLAIWWSFEKMPDGASDATAFTISENKRVLIQLPNTGGDQGPRIEFRRC